MTQINGTASDVNTDFPDSETVLRAPWVVFASGQGQRDEYGTTASTGIEATLEGDISALCREFHNALGVQEVPSGQPVVLFWQAHRSPNQSFGPSFHWVITQVLRASQQPGQRIAYEYFSLVLTPADLDKLSGNPLRALEIVGIEQLREHWAAGLKEPVCAAITNTVINNAASFETAQAPHFSQNGTWPATQENGEALLAYLDRSEAKGRTFATWWPGSRPPRSGIFDIVLRSEATRVARPHEILALATELSHDLSRNLLEPPSYDTEGARHYRALLQDAGEVEAMLKEAYFPAALEESPHRWMTRPQKISGLCQKIADNLPDYVARLPASFSLEIAGHCTELADRYGDMARQLQKLRHPNMLHQNQSVTGNGAAHTATYQSDGAQGVKQKGVPFALILASLLALCLLGLGIGKFIGKPGVGASKAHLQGDARSSQEQSDRRALALMRTRAQREVFRVAHSLAAQRASDGKGLSKEVLQSTIVDAVAQAMLQTPHWQIKPAQKQLLFRMATAPIRARAVQGVREGVKKGARRPGIRRAR